MCICQNTQSQRYYSEILSNPVKAHAVNFSMSENPVFVFFNFPLTIFNISLINIFKKTKKIITMVWIALEQKCDNLDNQNNLKQNNCDL